MDSRKHSFEPNDDWYSEKVGIAAPPIKTTDGWLLIFHGLSHNDWKYRLGAILLDSNNLLEIKAMLPYPIIEPSAPYEDSGLSPGTIFSCGAVVIDEKLICLLWSRRYSRCRCNYRTQKASNSA